jgi:hypothetical protein
MKRKSLLLALVALGRLFAWFNPAFAQIWTQTSAPITNWVSVASSADGTKLVAVAGQKGYAAEVGPIYTSTNSGVTWAATTAPGTNWASVAMSAVGNKLVAAANGGGIYTSTDSGATWTATTAPIANWQAVASSADGDIFVAAVGGLGFPFGPSVQGPVFISSDSGATWTGTDLPALTWTSVAVSADGSRLVAAPAGGLTVFSSTNSGSTWVPNTFPSSYLSSVAASADGTRLLAVVFDWVHYPLFHIGSAIYTSTDSGSLWQGVGSLGPAPISLAASADGSQWVAAEGGLGGLPGQSTPAGPLSISPDAGMTWIATGAPITNWSSVASSADGSKLVAVANGGGIWTSQSTPAPVLSITPSGTNLVLSWIVPSLDFELQENSDLTATNWMDVTNTPTLNLTNLQNQVTLSSPIGNRFYRLKSP